MQDYILRRLFWTVIALWAAATLLFFIMAVLPGDPVRMILGEESHNPELIEQIRAELGLDRAIHVRYLEWLGGVVRFDFGNSIYSGRPIAHEIAVAWPVTFALVGMALVVSAVIALPVGIISALKQNTWVDYALRLPLIMGLSIPSFWFAILITIALINLFKWFPPIEFAPFYKAPVEAMRQLFFPAIALGYRPASVLARMTRSCMLEVLGEDYIRTARAKGLKERKVVWVHALRNSFLPVLTLLGLEAAILIGGALMVEWVFGLPGMGSMLIRGVQRRDITLVQGIMVLILSFVLLLNLVVDIIYSWLDPRIRYGARR